LDVPKSIPKIADMVYFPKAHLLDKIAPGGYSFPGAKGG
jgi:hypothetical protein